jgi:predicted acetyltransferase
MTVELRLTDEDEGQVIRNLWPLYVHDVSAFDGNGPNRHGVLTNDDAVTTPVSQAEGQGPWWREPGVLFPYLILADGRPAGFNLVAARSRLPEGLDADFVVYEFFVLHAWRGSAVGSQAAVQGFDRHRGRWELVTYPNHPRAIAFWRRTIDAYTQGRFEQEECDHAWGRKLAFRFDNSADAPGD